MKNLIIAIILIFAGLNEVQSQTMYKRDLTHTRSGRVIKHIFTEQSGVEFNYNSYTTTSEDIYIRNVTSSDNGIDVDISINGVNYKVADRTYELSSNVVFSDYLAEGTAYYNGNPLSRFPFYTVLEALRRIYGAFPGVAFLPDPGTLNVNGHRITAPAPGLYIIFTSDGREIVRTNQEMVIQWLDDND